jgi:hypothetical protein
MFELKIKFYLKIKHLNQWVGGGVHFEKCFAINEKEFPGSDRKRNHHSGGDFSLTK